METKARDFEPERLFFCVPVSRHLPKARPIRHTNTKQSTRGLCFGGRGGSSRSKKDAGKKKSPLVGFWSRREVRSDGSFIGPDWSETQSIGFRV